LGCSSKAGYVAKYSRAMVLEITKMPYKIYNFPSLASTQDKAKEFVKKGLSNIVISADRQAKGHGRFKRKWHSAKGGLYASIILNPENTENIQYLTFAAAIAVVKSIKKIANLDAAIKWPNDVHYNKRKLCGILTEGIFGAKNHVIVGIGLNVNQDKFPKSIKNNSTSLKIIKHEDFNIKRILNGIIREFFILYNKYYNENKLKKITRLWEKYCDTIGKNVAVITREKKLHGRVVGVDENCSLLLKLDGGRTKKVIEGDIHVRY